MDDGSAPELLQPNQAAKLINFTGRNDFLAIRPPFEDQNLLFDNIEQYNWWITEVFQGSETYLTSNNGQGTFEIVASVGGRIFSLRPNNIATLQPAGSQVMSDVSGVPIDFIVREVTPTTGRNSKMLNRAWFCQADKYMVIQDGQSRAIIYQQGLTARRADPLIPEVPVGTIMVYGQNRLVVCIGGNKWKVGDLLGSKPGLNGAEVLQFTEDTYFNEGGFFSLPTVDNVIQAMRFTNIGDSNTGQGELLIYAASSVSSLNLSLPRDQWKDNPIQHIAFLGFGGVGDRAVVNVNSDVWGRAPDGVRSYVMSRRENVSWQYTPQSREVSNFLENDSEYLIQFCSAVIFDKRLLLTFSPYILPNGSVANRGLLALSFFTVSSMQDQTPPAWDGAWTGVDALQIITSNVGATSRCWVFSKSCTGPLKLFELKKEGDFDNSCQRITAVVETRAFNVGDPIGKKFLEGGRLWMDNLKGDITVSIKWKPDYYPCWLDWTTIDKCFDTHQCHPVNCRLPNLKPGYIRANNLPAPPDACNEITGENARYGDLFQFRLEITGNSGAVLKRIHGWFQPRLERSTGDCGTGTDCKRIDCCEPSDFEFKTDSYCSFGCSAGLDRTIVVDELPHEETLAGQVFLPDPCNTTYTVLWTIISKPEDCEPIFDDNTKLNPIVTFPCTGDYTFNLEVTDSHENVCNKEVTITIESSVSSKSLDIELVYSPDPNGDPVIDPAPFSNTGIPDYTPSVPIDFSVQQNNDSSPTDGQINATYTITLHGNYDINLSFTLNWTDVDDMTGFGAANGSGSWIVKQNGGTIDSDSFSFDETTPSIGYTNTKVVSFSGVDGDTVEIDIALASSIFVNISPSSVIAGLSIGTFTIT